MRLIDADALNVRSYCRWFDDPDDVRTVERMIREAPTITPPPNDPLTLDQLREMDGEPVYLDLGDGGEWVLVRVQQGKVFFTHKNTICAPANLLFECGGKAYRRKPGEGTQ